jgi:hypothetical protein
MHDTINNDVKGYIDYQTLFKDKLFVKGWCFNSNLGCLPLRIIYANIIKEIEATERSDVAKFYKNEAVNMCGFKFNIPKNTNCQLQMQINGEWSPVFNIITSNSTSLNTITEETTSDTDTEKNKSMAAADTTNVAHNASPVSEYEGLDIGVTKGIAPSFVVCDNFYKNPDAIRKFALSKDFNFHPDYHKGKRTDLCYRFPGLKERFEELLGCKITNWEKYGTNACFQYCIGGDQLVYHIDQQEYAGVLFLTPDAPPEAGTTFYRSKYNKTMKPQFNEFDKVFKGGFLDSTGFDVVDVVGNVYNRLVLFDAKLIHAATEYFGKTKEDGRLFQLFFFDLAK